MRKAMQAPCECMHISMHSIAKTIAILIGKRKINKLFLPVLLKERRILNIRTNDKIMPLSLL